MKIKPIAALILLGAMASGLSSCINESPKPESCLYAINLVVHSATEWLPEYDMDYTRADNPEVRYQFRVYQAGTTVNPVLEKTVYSDELSRPDFSLEISLHIGNYDVYVWSDLCDSATGESLFYNSSDFASISYLKPYEGDSDNKDAFRGATSFSVSFEKNYGKTVSEQITLNRPLARYMLVATDLQDFLGNAGSDDPSYRDASPNMFENYTVNIAYPLYMPAVFNNFTNKPFESWSDVSFGGGISPIGDGQALIGLDYVMINGEESNAQVAVEIKDDTGKVISVTGTMNIPIIRNRTTIVYGNFLTTPGDGDITLDPNFKGQHNIEYK